MRMVTNLLINDFNVKKLGVDFMGYKVDRTSSLDFHHLLVPRRECVNIPNFKDGYVYENGVILNHDTSHPYLHVIECLDYDKFLSITSEMYDMKVKGYLDIDNLKNINEILCEFECKFKDRKNKRGKLIIHPEYKVRVLTK